jgi:hypothetical protein
MILERLSHIATIVMAAIGISGSAPVATSPPPASQRPSPTWNGIVALDNGGKGIDFQCVPLPNMNNVVTKGNREGGISVSCAQH